MAVVVVAIIAITAPLVFMQRLLLRQAQRYVSVRGKGLKTQPLPLAWLALGCLRRNCILAVRDGGRAALRHHTAFFRRDLGRRREAARRADARSLSRARRLSERDPRHLQHARHRRDRRRRRRRLLHRDRACGAPLEFRLDAACRLPGDGAARDAGPGRRPCAAVGVPVRAVPVAAEVDDGLDLARLHHRLACLRHAARLRHSAAGRAGAGGSRAHRRRQAICASSATSPCR